MAVLAAAIFNFRSKAVGWEERMKGVCVGRVEGECVVEGECGVEVEALNVGGVSVSVANVCRVGRSDSCLPTLDSTMLFHICRNIDAISSLDLSTLVLQELELIRTLSVLLRCPPPDILFDGVEHLYQGALLPPHTKCLVLQCSVGLVQPLRAV